MGNENKNDKNYPCFEIQALLLAMACTILSDHTREQEIFLDYKTLINNYVVFSLSSFNSRSAVPGLTVEFNNSR